MGELRGFAFVGDGTRPQAGPLNLAIEDAPHKWGGYTGRRMEERTYPFSVGARKNLQRAGWGSYRVAISLVIVEEFYGVVQDGGEPVEGVGEGEDYADVGAVGVGDVIDLAAFFADEGGQFGGVGGIDFGVF